MDKAKLDKLLEKYPPLEILLQANVVSNKNARKILDIDRWLMEDLQRAMLMDQIIVGRSSTTWKGSDEAINHIRSRGK